MEATRAERFRLYLDDWLQARGWGPSRLEQESGISQSLISKWLHPDPERRATPSPKNLERLAPPLGVPYDDLMRLCGYLPGEPSQLGQDPDLAILTAAWPRLPDGLRDAIKILVGAGGRVSSHSNGHSNGTNTASAASTRTGDAPVDAKNAGLGVCKPVVGRAITAAPLRPRQLAAAPA